MNTKFYVPFETAKLLKKAGYPQSGSDMYYNPNGELKTQVELIAGYKEDYPTMIKYYIAAPAYCEVLDWLWATHTLDITTNEVGRGDYDPKKGRWSNHEVGFSGMIEYPHPHYTHLNKIDHTGGFYSTREEAYNAAIIKVLEELL